MKISTYNKQLLSLEDQQKPVRVSVAQLKHPAWGMEVDEMVDGGAHTSSTSDVSPPLEEIKTEEMKLPVPADGIIPLSIPLKNDTEILMIDVRSAVEHRRTCPWTT